MKLAEAAHAYHSNVKSWVSKAKQLAIADIIHLLDEESHRDPNWFLAKRRTRLAQLSSEILALKLHEASGGEWSEEDFMMHAHSDAITAAIQNVTGVVTTHYQKLKLELTKQRDNTIVADNSINTPPH